jgi:hypothetical protein
MAHIVEEGFRHRNKHEITGYLCLICCIHTTALGANGGCPQCGSNKHLQPVKSKALLHAETQAMKAGQKFKQNDFSPGFNAQDAKSQMGRPLTPDQLLEVLKKLCGSVIMKEVYNAHLRRKLLGIYIRKNDTKDDLYRSEFEVKQNLQFVCACEPGVMPEWDIVPLDDEGRPQTPIRGWRSVLGIFYRAGIIPFIPDDGRRGSWNQVKSVKPTTK